MENRNAHPPASAPRSPENSTSPLRQASRQWGLTDRLKAALATFRAFTVTIDATGSLSVGISVDPARGRADTGDLDVDLAELANDLADAATDRQVGVALFIDEMQQLERADLAALAETCHQAGQRDWPFYIIGAGLPNLPGVLADAKSYAERLFAYRRIGPLDQEAALNALIAPAKSSGVDWDTSAAHQVLDASNGYPYYLQVFGKSTWDVAIGPHHITPDDAATGISRGREDLDNGFFRSRWDRATPSERQYLAAMAADGDGPSASGQVARRLGKKASSFGPARANLIAKGLVFAPEHGQIQFTVPGMADFINRQDVDITLND